MDVPWRPCRTTNQRFMKRKPGHFLTTGGGFYQIWEPISYGGITPRVLEVWRLTWDREKGKGNPVGQKGLGDQGWVGYGSEMGVRSVGR